MNKIGERIKERRKSLNLSAQQVADLIGKDRATIYRYENGDIENLPTTVLEPLADALKTTPGYLTGWETFDGRIKLTSDDPDTFYSTIDSIEVTSPYGDHNANLDYFSDKPELLDIYKEIHNSESLQLLFDSAKDLTPQDLETVLMIIKGIKKERQDS